MRDRVLSVILEAVKRTGRELNAPALQDPTEQTVLYGDKSPLSSVDLVALLIDLEEGLSDALGKNIVLTDDRAMSQRTSPFRSVASLADFVAAIAS